MIATFNFLHPDLALGAVTDIARFNCPLEKFSIHRIVTLDFPVPWLPACKANLHTTFAYYIPLPAFFAHIPITVWPGAPLEIRI